MEVFGIKKYILTNVARRTLHGSTFLRAEYAFRNSRPQDYKDVVNQFITVAMTYVRSQKRIVPPCFATMWAKERWSDPLPDNRLIAGVETMGWYAMAFVDALDFISKHEAGRDSMFVILNNILLRWRKFKIPKPDCGIRCSIETVIKAITLESSCSTMFVYTLFKSCTHGLHWSFLHGSGNKKDINGILNNFIEVDKNGLVSITKAPLWPDWVERITVRGDYNYYINENYSQQRSQGCWSVYPASLEWERLQRLGCKLAK